MKDVLQGSIICTYIQLWQHIIEDFGDFVKLRIKSVRVRDGKTLHRAPGHICFKFRAKKRNYKIRKRKVGKDLKCIPNKTENQDKLKIVRRLDKTI